MVKQNKNRKSDQSWLARVARGEEIWTLFVLIVTAGVVSRFWLIDEPNFKPVGALALLAGFYFRRFDLGLAAAVCMMLISDLFIGFYEPAMMIAVYSSIAICCGLGVFCHRFVSQSVDWKAFAGFGVSSIAMSCLFFLLTNFAVWSAGQWYPTTLEGLASCYAAAIPFFRNTLSSDLLFSQGLLLAYGCVCMTANANVKAAVKA